MGTRGRPDFRRLAEAFVADRMAGVKQKGVKRKALPRVEREAAAELERRCIAAWDILNAPINVPVRGGRFVFEYRLDLDINVYHGAWRAGD